MGLRGLDSDMLPIGYFYHNFARRTRGIAWRLQVSLWGHEGSQSTAGRLVRYSALGRPDASPWCQSAIADLAARRSATYPKFDNRPPKSLVF
ncbi:MAG: hypothetical protein FWE95_04845 [Planctomycetaceae bacterium]|nr:hypothetical protein [Planctomycetaceae bacterium]